MGFKNVGLRYGMRRRRVDFMARGLLDRHTSEALCFAAPDFGFDAVLAGREARTGLYAKFRLFRRRRDHVKELR